ncbi:GTPase HflX [Liquorilactobacillus capillatus]|uniref:GTPase HflX n=1 Tax=Liquorilactobacillus capillatus DSM 19910 TaxID=1423731 RepID=A0A0R1M8C6_9LACO|nr:GTPase HflX [Liquorilactobacillus capillatus]KRL00539.1 GTP-binding protein [Liquorilactobacillus capillatus DSM 19910]
MIKVIIAGIENQQSNFDYLMQELAELAYANNMQVVADIRQGLQRPVAATYLGKGKIEELSRLAEVKGAEMLILNDELSPTQIRNLEKETALAVLDRTELILEIFSSRARTKEAQLQVEIARLKYKLPRLRTSSNEKLDQQSSGGSLANRGAGETKLEINRRTIQKRIAQLSRDLKNLDKEQEIQSSSRRESGLPSVALVGYTNSGKSTTMNGLLNLLSDTDIPPAKQVMTKDMLFATLDTSVRKLRFQDKREFLLSDTVGFVSKLPHNLVKAFQSTLAEVKNADLLLHVVDLSDKHSAEMVKVTTETLKELGVENTPTIYAFNKADKTDSRYPVIEGQQITYSARDAKSLHALADLIKRVLFKDYKTHKYFISFEQGRYLEKINQLALVTDTTYNENGAIITAEISPAQEEYFARFLTE